MDRVQVTVRRPVGMVMRMMTVLVVMKHERLGCRLLMFADQLSGRLLLAGRRRRRCCCRCRMIVGLLVLRAASLVMILVLGRLIVSSRRLATV